MHWLLLLAFTFGLARAEFQIPPLTGPVMDNAGMLSSGTERGLEQLLRQVRDAGGTQLQVLIVPELGGLSIEEASIKVADAWKLGSAKGDEGVLLIIAAKERRVRIEVGQGREGVLPDITASRIIREVIVPRFKQGDANQAVTAGVYAILHYTDPDFSPANAQRDDRLDLFEGYLGFFMFLLILVFAMFGSRRRHRGFWTGGSGWGGGGWGGGGFGGGGWGGGSGGGWSGGGGGFSGGGASGSW